MSRADGPVDVAILMGSKSDLEVMRPALQALEAVGLRGVLRVLSAHRTPAETVAFVRDATDQGVKVFICGAGGAAHLAGAVAAHTIRPVIGVPISTGGLGGMDSLLSTVQMPPGMPVATVAIGGAQNAGLLAAQIIAVGDEALARKVEAEREVRRRKVLDSDSQVRAQKEPAGTGRAREPHGG
jgi:phosphoribosylaminoimidazole carboxylase PurE protein